MRNNGDLEQDGKSEYGKKQADSGYILKAESWEEMRESGDHVLAQ